MATLATRQSHRQDGEAWRGSSWSCYDTLGGGFFLVNASVLILYPSNSLQPSHTSTMENDAVSRLHDHPACTILHTDAVHHSRVLLSISTCHESVRCHHLHSARWSGCISLHWPRSDTLHPLHAGAATNRLITAKDHASVQINVAEVDENGKMISGKNVSYAFSGYVRSIGEADDSFNMLATQDGREWIARDDTKFINEQEANIILPS